MESLSTQDWNDIYAELDALVNYDENDDTTTDDNTLLGHGTLLITK